MKNEIRKQIISERRSAIADKQAELDAKYFIALANGKKVTREIYKMPSLDDELSKRLRQLSGIKMNYRDFSVDIFKDLGIKTEYKKLYETLDKYVIAFPTPKNLCLVGAAGTGKTHAAQIVGTKLLGQGHSVLYITAFSLVQRFKDYIFNFERDALDYLFSCDLLIIDDLGTEPKIKNVSDEYLLNVINERMANDMPYIITTNLAPEDILARYDERLTSRILSKQTSIVIQMKSKDLRLI